LYEFVSHHHVEDTALEARLKAEFDRVADAPNASPATFSVLHQDGGGQTFTAKFESLTEARSFRAALACDPETDAQVQPRLDDLEPQLPERIEPLWSEPPKPTA
jgi:hypothetical protein